MPENFSILIVEDDEDARSNMEDILSLDGYRISLASSCMPALNAIESTHFDTVIVDWRLPDGNGSELIPAIKRALPNAPVIVVTGLREFETAVTALRKGAYDFLTKPVNADALRGLMRRLVERKMHLAEIESAQQKVVASERLAAIGQMVAGLAHESRNAFQRSHACLAELMLDLEGMADSIQLVRKVQKALDDLNFLLEEVREYSAPIILERRECNMRQLIAATWQEILDAKRLKSASRFTIDEKDDAPELLFADCNRLRQVVRNLLENALFVAGESGAIDVELRIELDPKTGMKNFVASVSDTGDGVPEENREEIFAPFFTTKTKGTGLGLAISSRIADAHAGSLTVTDAESGGAKFVLKVPLTRPRKKAR